MANTTPSRSASTNNRKLLPGAREKLLALLSTPASPGDEEEDSVPPAASPAEGLWPAVLGVVLESAYKQQEWNLAAALVRAGAGIGALDLHAAIRGGQDELAAALLEHGASTSALDTVGQTPLHLAAMQGNGAMAELLVNKGANVDAEVGGWTPLFIAAERGSVDVVQALMASGGADCGVRGGTSPLILAADNGHVDALKAMIELGGDVNAAGDGGWTALHSATGKAMVDALVDAGANIEARDSEDDTPLNYFAQYHAIEPMRALVSRGADINTQNQNGDSPLHFAARAAGDKGAADLIDFLLKSGAEESMVNRNNEAPSDVVGQRGHEDDTEENMGQVRTLLANAPADRAWRRRGLLLLCIARYRADGQQSTCSAGAIPCIDVQKPSSMELPGSGFVKEGGGGEWNRCAAWVAGLVQSNEGIFRTIVSFM